MALWFSQIFKNWRSKRAFLCIMSVFSNFLTNFNVRSPYLFLKTSAMECLGGNLSLVRKINTNNITKICFDYTSFNLEVENLREILKKNSYPSGIIQQSLRSFLNKLHVPKKVIPTVPKKELFIVLPYLGTLSSNLKQKLRTCFKNSLPQCNIKIIFKSTNHLASLFRFKDVIPKELQSHLVYKFLSGNCNVTYYGKTEHHLNVRSSEHIGISH